MTVTVLQHAFHFTNATINRNDDDDDRGDRWNTNITVAIASTIAT